MPTLDLAPETIVDVARGLIDRHGLEGFSMRKLAAALDVNPMTIYLRFENKDALLDAVAVAAMREVPIPDAAKGPWSDQVLAYAVALRAHLVDDRQILRLVSDPERLNAGLLAVIDRGLELMAAGDLDGAEAVAAFRVLFWHTVGSALVAGSFATMPASRSDLGAILADAGDRYPSVVGHAEHFGPVDADRLFEHTTTLLIDGLRSHPEETP